VYNASLLLIVLPFWSGVVTVPDCASLWAVWQSVSYSGFGTYSG
jgi:hypothetical protein